MLKEASARASIVTELLRYFWRERLWWMIPFVAVLLVIGALLIVGQASPVAPFLYAVF